MPYFLSVDRANLHIMPTLDETDARILLALSEDSRQTVVAMAGQLGLSRNTVQARLASLEKRDAFLAFDHRISTAALGYPLTAFISIHVQQQMLGELATSLAAIPEVVEAHGLSGRADLLVRVVSTGAEDLFRINGKILACPGVDRTETSLAMNEIVPFRLDPLLRRVSKPDPSPARD